MIRVKDHYQSILRFGEAHRTQRFSIPEFTGKIRKIIETDDIRVYTKRNKGLSRNNIVVCGLYDSFEDQINAPSINIYLNFSSKQKNICIKNLDWPTIALSIVECVGHELVHQEQYRSRDFDIGPEFFVSSKKDRILKENQEYLGSLDEIEAYGYSIAAEIFLTEGPKRITGKHVVKTAIYKSYHETFGSNHIVVRHLLENVLKHYNRLLTTGE